MLGLSVSAGHGLSGPLYRVDQVPENFHEHYIIRGYRHPKSSVTQCLLSLFDATNETLNFWTHFLATWYFAWVLCHLSSSFNFLLDPYTWPLLCYLVVCCAFPMASAIAHLFNVMSEEARQFCFFLDYSALSLFSCAVAVCYRAYCFPVQLLSDDGSYTWFRDNFVRISVVNALLCTTISCMTRFMKPTPLRKALRLGSFAYPYVYDCIPIIYRLLYCAEGDCQLAGQYYHSRQFFLAFLSSFLYASHLPERLLPGSFDIVGHSHQLFHVTSILGVMYQIQAVLLDVKERKDVVQPLGTFNSWSNNLGTVLLVMFANIVIIALYSIRLFRQRHHSKTT